MPRDAQHVYSKPPGTTAEPLTTIQSSQFNGFADDVAQDLNTARAIAVGGTGATTAAAARTNLGVVPQTGTMDVVAGRLLIVGAGGLLGNAPSVDNFNTHTANGWFQGSSSAAVGLPEAADNFIIQHVQRGSSVAIQWAFRTNSDQVYFRRRTAAATWTTWVRFYNRGDIVGTVSMSSGIPAGAIIESGSNANGRYIRYADGTQICTHTIDLGTKTAAGAGTYDNPYRTNIAAWTFPATFLAGGHTVISFTPFVETTTVGERALAVSFRAISTTELSGIAAFQTNSNATSISVSVGITATGRWI